METRMTPTVPIDTCKEQHYRIAELAERWDCSKEKVRLLVKDEPDVLRISTGKKKLRTTYRIPESVVHRIHNRLLA
jgi:hypothetical protein